MREGDILTDGYNPQRYVMVDKALTRMMMVTFGIITMGIRHVGMTSQ